LPAADVNAFGTARQRHLAFVIFDYNIRHHALMPAVRIDISESDVRRFLFSLNNHLACTGNHCRRLACVASAIVLPLCSDFYKRAPQNQ
jgi:hypothetical protein